MNTALVTGVYMTSSLPLNLLNSILDSFEVTQPTLHCLERDLEPRVLAYIYFHPNLGEKVGNSVNYVFDLRT